MKTSTVLWLIAQVATASAIRVSNATANATEMKATAQNATVPAQNATDTDNSEVADQALSAVTYMLNAHKAPVKATVNSSAPRAKLDVGFTDFAKDLTGNVTAAIENNTHEAEWTADLRKNLIQNVTDAFSASVKEALVPLKQSVGKTWMALPEDDQKNEYVSQLKAGFAPILASSLQTIIGHLNIGLRRVKAYAEQSNKLQPQELLTRSEKSLEGDILQDRCYGDSFAQLWSSAIEEEAPNKTKAVPAKVVNATKPIKKFCLPSVVKNLVKRLNDTQMLFSMTMRFEARAMDLAQTGKK